MTEAQETVLVALLRGPLKGRSVAQRTGMLPAPTGRVLYALFRRSLVTIDDLGTWKLTTRGEARAREALNA